MPAAPKLALSEVMDPRLRGDDRGGEMSISNRKPGEKKEAPAEPLKRSIAGTMKAIARKQDLEVTFASDRPALMGDKARLPEPPRRCSTRSSRPGWNPSAPAG